MVTTVHNSAICPNLGLRNHDEVSGSKLRSRNCRGWNEGSPIKEVESDGVRPSGDISSRSTPSDCHVRETLVLHAERVPVGLVKIVQEVHAQGKPVRSTHDCLDGLLVYSHMFIIIVNEDDLALSEKIDECVVLAHTESESI